MQQTTTTAFSAPVPLSRTVRVNAPRCARMCADAETPDVGAAAGPAKYQPIRSVKSTASWKNTYIEDFGTKGPGSRPDFDLRPMSLRTSNLTEEEAKTCAYCHGSGVRQCSFCEGIEFIVNGKVSPCPACAGQSEVTCSTCFGTAKQIELVRFAGVLAARESTLLLTRACVEG